MYILKAPCCFFVCEKCSSGEGEGDHRQKLNRRGGRGTQAEIKSARGKRNTGTNKKIIEK